MSGRLDRMFVVPDSPRRQWLSPPSAAAIIVGLLAAGISLLPDWQDRLIAVAPFLLAALAWWTLLRPLHWWIALRRWHAAAASPPDRTWQHGTSPGAAVRSLGNLGGNHSAQGVAHSD